jgi:hypothetical protein
VTLDVNENLYVTDTGNDRIQFWPNGGIFGSTVAGTGKQNNNTGSSKSSVIYFAIY